MQNLKNTFPRAIHNLIWELFQNFVENRWSHENISEVCMDSSCDWANLFSSHCVDVSWKYHTCFACEKRDESNQRDSENDRHASNDV